MKIKDSCYHYFGSIFLGHGMYRIEDFGHVMDSLTEL